MRAVTFDIDWAPDWAVALCAEMCRKAGAPATFFVTHRQDVLADLDRRPDVELGLHPNFLPGSSHGDTADRVLDHLLGIVPQARSMRSHALVQSSPILLHVCRSTPIENDVSIFLPFCPGLRPTRMVFEAGGRWLTRLPYWWEDDVAACWPGWTWDAPMGAPSDDLRIYAFHPIHVALNMATLEAYRAFKASLDGRPLHAATVADCAPFVHHGAGTRTCLERLLAAAGADRFDTVSAIAER